MPYPRKNSPYWYITYTNASGKRVRESAGTTDKGEAAELERRRRSEAWAASKLGKSIPHTVDEVLVVYLKHLGETAAGARARYAAKRLIPEFTGQIDIAGAQITEYRQKRARDGMSDSTIRKELGVLSAAYNYARKELGWEVVNPAAGRLGRRPQSRMRWITRKEGEALIEAARGMKRSPYLWPFIQLGLFTGMRRGEMLGLEWPRVDFDQRLVYLRPSDQKSRRYDSVPLNQRAIEALTALTALKAHKRAHKRWVFTFRGKRIQRIQKSFLSACEKAGIEDFRIHDMRHTCAAWMVQAGVGLREVAEVLRHSDIRTTMCYAHLAPENTRRAVSVLDKL